MSELLPWPVFGQQGWSEEGPCTVTLCRRQVIFTDEEYSKGADTMGLGMARPPRRSGRAKMSLSVAVMLSRPVMEGMK